MHSGIKIITIDVHKPIFCVGTEEPLEDVMMEKALRVLTSLYFMEISKRIGRIVKLPAGWEKGECKNAENQW